MLLRRVACCGACAGGTLHFLGSTHLSCRVTVCCVVAVVKIHGGGTDRKLGCMALSPANHLPGWVFVQQGTAPAVVVDGMLFGASFPLCLAAVCIKLLPGLRVLWSLPPGPCLGWLLYKTA